MCYSTFIILIFYLLFQVHMGTHMWSNGASRRGRRMSLDLPPIPMTPKDSEFLQRRPDLFYPYLPAPFLNGMQQKVKKQIFKKLMKIKQFSYKFFSEPQSQFQLCESTLSKNNIHCFQSVLNQIF